MILLNNTQLESLRIFVKLSKYLQWIDFKKYEYASKLVVEIAKLIGEMFRANREFTQL